MAYRINAISYCPKYSKDITKPNACEVTFATSDHGLVRIQTGSKTAHPVEYEQHIRMAAQILARTHRDYEQAVRATWGFGSH